MISSKLFVEVLAYSVAVWASPVSVEVGDVSVRQASEIPPNSLCLVEWYPRGCGQGSGVSLNGGEETLESCIKFDGLYDPDAPDTAAVRFYFPDDGRTFKWQIFSTNTCETEKNSGEGAGCFNVPKDTNVGAVIVLTSTEGNISVPAWSQFYYVPLTTDADPRVRANPPTSSKHCLNFRAQLCAPVGSKRQDKGNWRQENDEVIRRTENSKQIG
jgi:hypothetical protein